MSINIHLADGEEFVEGRSPEKARELLELAKAAGLEGQVKTTGFGYIVPSAIFKDSKSEESTEEESTEEESTEGSTEENTETEGEDSKEFDPADATVDEVKAYLDGADDAERERVLAAEEAGKGRKGILDLAVTPEGAK